MGLQIVFPDLGYYVNLLAPFIQKDQISDKQAHCLPQPLFSSLFHRIVNTKLARRGDSLEYEMQREAVQKQESQKNLGEQ